MQGIRSFHSAVSSAGSTQHQHVCSRRAAHGNWCLVQARVCEWLGEAYEAMAAHGVASADPEPDQDTCDAMHDAALIDHSMQTDSAGRMSDDAKVCFNKH